ncbi:hypothetical protein C0991_001143 [Blastosporella zonata]|nr:hypothetical protein C0991_001143 [Blastosporella zonata]
MSPDRQQTSGHHAVAKPYSRPATPSDSPTRRSVDLVRENTLKETVDSKDPPQETPETIFVASKPGFPTYEEYKQIEEKYINSLAASRREKALISQAMFDRIWAVLHAHDVSAESASFRFWARKQFSLGKRKKPAASSTEPSDSQTVVLHEANLVAIQEQIYEILCYGHGISNHGGRDRTCYAIREHYTWVPKELITQFVRMCPTCIAKKCGMKDKGDHTAKTLRRYLRNLVSVDDSGEEDTDGGKKSVPRAGPSKTCQEKENLLVSADSNNRLDRIGNYSAPGVPQSVPMSRETYHSAPAKVSVPQSAAMSREVSLFQGLPNGWQFRHDNLAAAQDEFILSKNAAHIPSSGARSRHPRIPSIAPMMRTSLESPGNNGMLPLAFHSNDNDAEGGSTSSPELLALHSIPGSPWFQDTASTIPDSEIEISSISSAVFSNSFKTRSIAPPSIIRPAAPSSIDLQDLSTQETIEAFLALRGSSSDFTPNSDSPQPTAPLPSPASSDSSSLSTLAMVAVHSMSPANTALPTPVDQARASCDTLGKDFLAQQAGMMILNVSTEAVCDHASSVIVL